MTCESAKIGFVCNIIAFMSVSLGNDVFLNMSMLCFRGHLWKYLKCGKCLHLYLVHIPVFPKGSVSICPLLYSKLDIDHWVP